MALPEAGSVTFGWKKELVLVRGLPGSGKSTEANEAVGHNRLSSIRCPRIVEADHYMFVDGKYEWHQSLVDLAHKWCFASAFWLLRKYDRIAVANTFIRRWQIVPYIEQARKFQIRVWLREAAGNELPQSDLAQRNVHGVSVERIEQMMLEWEDMTQEEVDILLGLPQELRSQVFVNEPMHELNR